MWIGCFYCSSAQLNCCTSIQMVVGCFFPCVRVCMKGVKLNPLSLADGHREDGLTQEQWGPLTKMTPSRHVASSHRGNPPWDRERADSWRGGLTKMESISFHWGSRALYLFPLPPVHLYCGPLWMRVTTYFTASCDWPYGPDSPPTTPPDIKWLNETTVNLGLYGLALLLVIREYRSYWQRWARDTRFHTHCTPHFKVMSTLCTDKNKQCNQLFVLFDFYLKLVN